jgi:hypothetical protein
VDRYLFARFGLDTPFVWTANVHDVVNVQTVATELAEIDKESFRDS